ncbi:acetolactate synthase-1/2/3 large subunit [Nakamurella sp. UYEF19]|uniref:5-guanidino-2-oxopentanoate decarboxylase n=1 Tax=Nakamurella sp. UYEF19 TaxID=1756392 RepID=UPI003397C850
MKFGEAIIDLIANSYDVDTVFGIPGVHTIEFYRGVHSRRLHSVVPRHEQGGAFMADGYTRVTGKPGVCLFVTGPGVLNAMTPIAQAWHDSIPMLVLAATTASGDLGRGRGPLHDVGDQTAMTVPITSISETVSDPDRFAELIAQAWQSWAVGRPRPVHLAVPVDLLSAEVGPIKPVRLEATPTEPDQTAVTSAAQALRAAVRPVILAGGGALGAPDGIRLLAERLDAPVVTTGNAKGLIPADHPLSVGTLLPFSPVLDLIERADVVLAIGTEFSDVDRIYTGAELKIPGTLIRVDIDRGQLDGLVKATIGIAADAALTIEALLLVLPAHPQARGGAERTRKTVAAVTFSDQTEQHGPWLDALGSVLTDDTVTVLDSTQLAYSALHRLPGGHPGNWIASYGLGTLGPALPMAVGARIGRQEAPVVAVAGDGGVLFTLPELATAVDTGGQLTLVIWDNAGYGEIRDSFDRAAAPRIGTETSAHDLVAIARGFGAAATRVDTPEIFADELGVAATRQGVSVVVATEPGSPATRPH